MLCKGWILWLQNLRSSYLCFSSLSLQWKVFRQIAEAHTHLFYRPLVHWGLDAWVKVLLLLPLHFLCELQRCRSSRFVLHCLRFTAHTFLTNPCCSSCSCEQRLCLSNTVLCFYVGSWRKPSGGWIFHVLLQRGEKILPLPILLVCRADTEEDLESVCAQ